MGFMSGYGMHVRALRGEDLREERYTHPIDLGDSDLDDCVAIEGEDLARELTAVVDVRNFKLVWSSIPSNNTEVLGDYQIDPIHHKDFAKSIVLIITLLFPWVALPLPPGLVGAFQDLEDL